MKRISNRKNNNNKRKRDVFDVPRTVKGIPCRKCLYLEDTIYSTNGGLYPNFFSTNNIFLSFHDIFDTAKSQEYLDLRTEFQCVRMISFRVEVSRLIAESSLPTTYANGMPQLHLIYLPGYLDVATSNTTTLRNDNALIISPQLKTKVSKAYRPPDMQCIVLNNGVYYVMNPSKPFSTNFNCTFPGTLQIGWTATTAALQSIPLFQVRILALCEFTVPF